MTEHILPCRRGTCSAGFRLKPAPDPLAVDVGEGRCLGPGGASGAPCPGDFPRASPAHAPGRPARRALQGGRGRDGRPCRERRDAAVCFSQAARSKASDGMSRGTGSVPPSDESERKAVRAWTNEGEPHGLACPDPGMAVNGRKYNRPLPSCWNAGHAPAMAHTAIGAERGGRQDSCGESFAAATRGSSCANEVGMRRLSRP